MLDRIQATGFRVEGQPEGTREPPADITKVSDGILKHWGLRSCAAFFYSSGLPSNPSRLSAS